MEEKLIYPKILPEEEVIKMIDEKSNKERVTHMQKEFESLEKLKNRYIRVKNSWGKNDSIVKIVGSFIALLTGAGLITSIAIGGIGLIPIGTLMIIESILSSTTTLSGFSTVALSMRWTKRKKKQYNARLKLIEEYKNKLFYFMLKTKEDNVITIDELKQFDKMLDEFNLELKFQQTKREYNMISSMSQPGTFTLNEKDIKRINKEVLKENKQIIINQKKEELKKSTNINNSLRLFCCSGNQFIIYPNY